MISEKEYHDKFYEQESEGIFSSPIFLEVNKKYSNFLIKNSILSHEVHVLSIGSGDGKLEIEMSSLVKTITGVELSESAVQKAIKKAKEAKLKNLHFQAGDITEIDFDDDSFDVIWAPALLHHLDDIAIDKLLDNSRKWLKPGGIFISIDPSSRRLVGLFKNLFAKKYDKYHSPDERELDIKSLTQSLRKAGFKQIIVKYPDYFIGPLAWLFPNIPNFLVSPISFLDTLLSSIPVVNLFASSFSIIARK